VVETCEKTTISKSDYSGIPKGKPLKTGQAIPKEVAMGEEQPRWDIASSAGFTIRRQHDSGGSQAAPRVTNSLPAGQRR